MASINQVGSNINGNVYYVSINEYGDRIAIGNRSDNKTLIYEWNGSSSSWGQLGNDINGESGSDNSGYSVSLNCAGDIVAIGAIKNDGGGSDSGQVRIFQYNGTDWGQLGNDINGGAAYDEFGYSVSLNRDGNIVAIGATGYDGHRRDNIGQTKIFEYDGTYWNQLGQNINGNLGGENLGSSVSLNDDGDIVAIGSPNYGSRKRGRTKIFKYISGSWTQLGGNIDGPDLNDKLGWSVSLNSDGNIVAIGVKFGDEGGVSSGETRVYEYDSSSNSWNLIGGVIAGEAAGDQSGTSVSLNGTGDMVAIAALINNGGGNMSGHTRIFKLINGSWTQIGNDINGQAANDEFGYSVSLSKYGNNVVIASRNGSYTKVYNIQIIEQIDFDISGETRAVSMNNSGTRIAIGIPSENTNTGQTKVYEWDNINNIWGQLGNNLNGSLPNNYFGTSVSLNSVGDIIAIGAHGNDGVFTTVASCTRIFQYNSSSNTWNQLGGDIDGEAAGDKSGTSVSLNSAGDIVAIGAPFNSGGGSARGHTRIYQYNSSTTSWDKIGQDINGETNLDLLGSSVSLNNVGNRVAIGIPERDEGGKNNIGQTKIFEYNNGTDTWVRLGSNINGTNSNERSGNSVSLNDAGDFVAIGSNGYSSNKGRTRIFQLINDSWNQLGGDIDGEAADDYSGYSVSLNSEGNIIAIGATFNDGGGSNSGQLRIYRYDTNSLSWEQYGIDIDGQAADNQFGSSVSINGKGNKVVVCTDNSNYTQTYQLNLVNNLQEQIANSNFTMNNEVTNGVDVTYKRILTPNLNIFSFNASNVTVINENPSFMMLSLDALDDYGNVITGLTGLTGNDRIYVEIVYTEYDSEKGYHLIKYNSDMTNYVVSPYYPVPLTPVTGKTNTLGGYLTGLSNIGLTLNTVTCFLGNVKILCYDMTTKSEYYNEIQNIKENDYIKTFGTEKEYSKVIYLNKELTCNEERILKKKRLYQHKVYKDIILTGIHSLLYDDLSEELYKNMIDETNWKDDFMKVGDKKKLMAHLDPDFEIYNEVENTFVYQIGIQSKNDNLSYGLYLEHNLFAETTSIKSINKKNKLYNLDLIKS